MVPYGSPDDIGVIQLAWLGDSVWELHQRLRHVHFPLKSKDLHLSVVNEVKAKSQSKSLSQIEHLLNSNEMDLIRRARNKTKRYPKSSESKSSSTPVPCSSGGSCSNVLVALFHKYQSLSCAQ